MAVLSGWEAGILLWVQQFIRHPILTPAVELFTELGNSGILFILITLVLLILPRTRKLGLAAALGLLLSLLFTNIILKNLVQRVRPFTDFPAIQYIWLFLQEHDPNSFPSGHTSAAFAFAFATFPGWRKWWGKAAVVLLAILMGLSRLYVGVHYPTDVLAGLAVGTAAGLLGWLICRRLYPILQEKLSRCKTGKQGKPS